MDQALFFKPFAFADTHRKVMPVGGLWTPNDCDMKNTFARYASGENESWIFPRPMRFVLQESNFLPGPEVFWATTEFP